MERLTHKRENGIKRGYWSPNKKQELVDRLAMYEDQEEKGRWIPISEQLPEDESYIIVSFENATMPDIARYEENDEGGTFYPGDDEKSYSSFSNGSEDFHFLFNSSLDCIEARCKKLTWVISFTLLIFAFLDVFTCSICERKLALCVNIDLGNSKVDSFLDHVCRNTCTTVKY